MMKNKIRILLCEDDENLGTLLHEYLQSKGYKVDLKADGEEGYIAFTKNTYDICILDVMMPKKDGFTLAVDIRNHDADIPIIFLTAKMTKEDVLQGFKLGADDYLTKPFSMEELIYRIESIMRRIYGKKERSVAEYNIGKFVFNYHKQMLTLDDKVIRLTTKESELLTLLVENANIVLERNLALKTIWADDNYFNARSMDVYITKLRKLLKDDPNVSIINIHGKGYKLIVSNE